MRNPGYGLENRSAIINIAEIRPAKHVLLNLTKNPYSLNDKEYFDKRSIQKIEARFRQTIYKKYNHKCPECLESLHNGEEVELHHIKAFKDGGKYTISNIRPLHQICHQKVTYAKENITES